MKTLVLFDSNYGNTKTIAYEIAKTFTGDTKVVSADDFKVVDAQNLDLLIVGCPIIGWRPTEKIIEAFHKIKLESNNFKFATFDTRVKLFFHGDAKDQMSKMISQIGGTEIINSHAFYVKGKEGPILDGEIASANKWATEILQKINEVK